MADLFIIGQFEGVASTTAVSIGSQVMHMITVMIVGLAMGATVTIGRAVGAENKPRAALYFGYNYAAPFLPQLEKNLHWLDAEFAKLTEYQQKRNNTSK